MINVDLKYESYLLYLQALHYKGDALSYVEFCKLLYPENDDK